MEAELHIDIGPALDVLNRLQNRLTNLRPLLLEIGEDEVQETKERFITTTDPDGNLWEPNSPVTLALKISTKPLTGETGDLMKTTYYQESGGDTVSAI